MILHILPEIGRKIVEEVRAPIPDPEIVFKKITPAMRKSSRAAGEFVRLCCITLFLKVLRTALVITGIWIAAVCLWHVDKELFPWEVELKLDDLALKYRWQVGSQKLNIVEHQASPGSTSKASSAPGSVESNSATVLSDAVSREQTSGKDRPIRLWARRLPSSRGVGLVIIAQ